MSKRISLSLLLALVVFPSSCSSTKQWEDNRKNIEAGLGGLEQGDLRTVAARMDVILADTEESSSEFSLQRFYAAFILAQAHMAASLGRAFEQEATTATSSVGGIGQRNATDGTSMRDSINGHLAAAIYHASTARDIYSAAARSGPKHEDVTLLPENLWNLGVANADANLQIVITAALARMGFRDEVAKILVDSPDLLKWEACLDYLEQYDVQKEITPWIAYTIFEYLKTREQRDAYYFGVLAVEGKSRYGQALPKEVVDGIEDWIVDNPDYVFCDPESTTTRYIRGETRSLTTGNEHIRYIPIAREDVED